MRAEEEQRGLKFNRRSINLVTSMSKYTTTVAWHGIAWHGMAEQGIVSQRRAAVREDREIDSSVPRLYLSHY